MGVQAAPQGKNAFRRYKQSDYTGGTQSYMGAQGATQTDFSDPRRGQAPTMTGQSTVAQPPTNPMVNTSTGIKDASEAWNGGAPVDPMYGVPAPAAPAPAAPVAQPAQMSQPSGRAGNTAEVWQRKSGGAMKPPHYNPQRQQARQGWRAADPATRGNRRQWMQNYMNPGVQ